MRTMCRFGPTGLDLVHDQRDAKLGCHLAYALDELGGSRDDAALGLNDLHDHGRRNRNAPVRVGEYGPQVLRARLADADFLAAGQRAAAWIWEEVHTGHGVGDGCLLRDKTGDCHGAVGAAVERPLERNDLAAPCRRLAELQRRVDSVRAGRTAELDLHPVPHRFGQERELELDELVLERRGEIEAVDEYMELALDRLDDFRMIVPEGEHTRTGEEVDEHVAIDVLDVRALCAGDADREPPWVGAGVRLAFRLPVEEPPRFRSGDRRPDSWLWRDRAHAALPRSWIPDICAIATRSLRSPLKGRRACWTSMLSTATRSVACHGKSTHSFSYRFPMYSIVSSGIGVPSPKYTFLGRSSSAKS